MKLTMHYPYYFLHKSPPRNMNCIRIHTYAILLCHCQIHDTRKQMLKRIIIS